MASFLWDMRRCHFSYLFKPYFNDNTSSGTIYRLNNNNALKRKTISYIIIIIIIILSRYVKVMLKLNLAIVISKNCCTFAADLETILTIKTKQL